MESSAALAAPWSYLLLDTIDCIVCCRLAKRKNLKSRIDRAGADLGLQPQQIAVGILHEKLPDADLVICAAVPLLFRRQEERSSVCLEPLQDWFQVAHLDLKVDSPAQRRGQRIVAQVRPIEI